MRAALIFNPSSGRARGKLVASAMQQGLTKRGLEVELYATQGPQDATALAREAALEADIVVAVGGDGTVNEVINGMAGAGMAARPAPAPGGGGAAGAGSAARDTTRRCLLGIVPAGTVNVLALELKLPFRVEQACDAIAGGKTTVLDLGRANDRRFVLMTGAGIDALTVRNIDPRTKKLLRELAFVGTGLHNLADRPPAFLVRTGGREYQATYVVASNTHYYAAHLSVTPSGDPADGLLDLMLFSGTTRSSLAAFWLGVPSGLHLRNPHVTCLRAERAELVALPDSEPVWFQTDGELAGELPATVEIHPHALEVLVP